MGCLRPVHRSGLTGRSAASTKPEAKNISEMTSPATPRAELLQKKTPRKTEVDLPNPPKCRQEQLGAGFPISGVSCCCIWGLVVASRRLHTGKACLHKQVLRRLIRAGLVLFVFGRNVFEASRQFNPRHPTERNPCYSCVLCIPPYGLRWTDRQIDSLISH